MDDYPGGQQDYPDDKIDFVEDELRHKKKKKPKSNKSKNDEQLEKVLEGYIMEPTDISNIAKGLNWARVSKQPMNFSNAKLEDITKKAFAAQRMGPMSVFNTLPVDQRRVITRLIAESQDCERDEDALWVLECVRRYTKKVQRHSIFQQSPSICVRLMVIIKRQDKHAGRDGRVPYKRSPYQPDEIIDLSLPLQKKKGKKNKKNKKVDDDDQVVDFPPVQVVSQEETGPWKDIPIEPIRVSDFHEQQQQVPGAYPDNPFNNAYDPLRIEERREPQFHARAYTPLPHHRRDRRASSRSRSHHRRADSRHRGDRERDMEEFHREDDLDDHAGRWDVRDTSPRSSQESYRGFWSGDSGGTLTPQSSPPMSEYGGHRMQYRRDDYPPRRRYRDASTFVEPHRNDDRRRGREGFERFPTGILRIPSSSRRRQGPALLHQDDYPINAVRASSRRALPEVPGEGYFPAEFNNRRRQSRAREAEPMYRDDQRDFRRRAGGWD